MRLRWTVATGALHKRSMLHGLTLMTALLTGTSGGAGGLSGVELRDNSLVVRFDDRAGSSVGKAQVGRGGPVEGLKQPPRGGASRLVLDLSTPGDPEKASDGRSRNFVTRNAGDNSVGKGRIRFDAPADMAARPRQRLHSITVAIPAASRGLSLPQIEGVRDGARPLIVIDAGHGGHDPGAINKDNGKREKDVTLAIAQAIRDQLVKSGRVRVALTRDDDKFLVLQERYGIARKLGADLFISIHADAAENAQAHGATVYTLSETASDREASRLAARENKADIINGVNLGEQSGDVSSILIDLTQRESMNISANFARLLQREAAPFVPFRSAAHRFASLMVLKAPDTPSVLFETGYISNVDDAAFLSSREGQQKIARGVARAVEVHFARKLAMRGDTAGG
ncbi:N-acetylmuramoyl-L-alanine amidase family protein [Sphingobium sp.]|uniref:N-acetylmuramoyl-L-alanine amidase family protein n=1 Tax=Sphingobium sp. TaxID=1912891 RepID=UPI003BB55FA6